MDATQIRFVRGEPLYFRSRKPFTVGGEKPVAIRKGAEILFDGQEANIDGEKHVLPQLKGAINTGWLVLAEHYDENALFQRPSAQIKVSHPTQGGNPFDKTAKTTPVTTENDERTVTNIASHSAATTARNNGLRGTGGATQGVAEAQEGVAVKSLKVASKQRTTLTGETAGSVIMQANQPPAIDAGRGMTEEEMLDRMSSAEREKYVSEKSAYKARYVNEPMSAAPPPPVQGTRVVGHVKSPGTTQSSGFTIKGSVGSGGGGGISDGDGTVVGTIAKSEQSVTYVEGMKFTQTNGSSADRSVAAQQAAQHAAPVAPVAPASALPGFDPSMCLKIAKALCANFPDSYDFGWPVKKKAARIALDFEDNHDVLRAIFAAENDSEIKALLVRDYPQVFAAAR